MHYQQQFLAFVRRRFLTVKLQVCTFGY